MPKYTYIAKSSEGEEERGVLEAENEFQLARKLRVQGFILISAREERKGRGKKSIGIPFLKGRIRLVDKMMFTRNLRVMISAGIALPRALEILSQQVKSKKFKEVVLDIKDEIMRGKSFSDSLLKHPAVFSDLFSSMIKVGEEGGKLEEVLGILARQMEREHELRSKIQGAMMYPAVIIFAMLGIGALMLVMVVPKIAATFKELEISLPPTTKFVIWLGESLATRWYLILGGIFLFPFFFFRLIKTNSGKRFFDTLVLKIPIISPILKKTNSAYTTRILSSLFASGVPITRSLEILSATLGNIHYKKAIALAAEKVRKGVKLSDVLIKYQDIYPPVLIQMIAVGEETGQTSEILEKLADFFEDEVTNATKNLASVIEPLLMLLIGGAVGFFAISMVQPMYSMLEAIK